MRDLTWKQFRAKLARHGMRLHNYMSGYCVVHPGVNVYRHNGGTTLREQLAYLLKQQRRLKDFYS